MFLLKEKKKNLNVPNSIKKQHVKIRKNWLWSAEDKSLQTQLDCKSTENDRLNRDFTNFKSEIHNHVLEISHLNENISGLKKKIDYLETESYAKELEIGQLKECLNGVPRS